MRSKIRVYYRVFMVRSSDDFVFLLTQKNTREKYTLSLSLSDAKEGRKKRGHHAVAGAFSVVSFSHRFSRRCIRQSRHGRDGCEGTYILTLRKRSEEAFFLFLFFFVVFVGCCVTFSIREVEGAFVNARKELRDARRGRGGRGRRYRGRCRREDFDRARCGTVPRNAPRKAHRYPIKERKTSVMNN